MTKVRHSVKLIDDNKAGYIPHLRFYDGRTVNNDLIYRVLPRGQEYSVHVLFFIEYLEVFGYQQGTAGSDQ